MTVQLHGNDDLRTLWHGFNFRRLAGVLDWINSGTGNSAYEHPIGKGEEEDILGNVNLPEPIRTSILSAKLCLAAAEGKPIVNNEVYVGTILKGKGDAQSSFGLVPISTQFQRIIFVPSGGSVAFALVEEMVEVYYNSNQFGKTLRAIEKLFDNPFALYEALGAFYDKKGYMDISHTRIRRYEILQEFLQEYVDEEQMDYYRQLMICDLYARENMKTRPAWAKDLKAYKRDIREFYLKEEETHEYLPEYEGYDEKQLARMTHLERMDYDPDTGVREPCWILFDYRSRDVLTYDAKMVKLSLVDIMQK